MAWVAEDEDVESIDVVEEEPRQRDRQQELRAPRRDDHGGMPPDHEEVEEEEPRKTKGKYLIPGIAAVALVIALLPLGAFVLKSMSGGNQQAANPGMGQQMQQPQPYYQAPPTGQQQPNGGFGPTQPQPTPGAYPQQPAPAQVAQQYAPQQPAYPQQQPQAPAAVAPAEPQGGVQPQTSAVNPQGTDTPPGGGVRPAPQVQQQPAMATEEATAAAAKAAAQVTDALAKDIGDTKLAISGLAVTTTETKETLVALSAKVDDLARSVDQLKEGVEKLVGKKALSKASKASHEQASQPASAPTAQPALTAQVSPPVQPPAPPAAVSTPVRRPAPARGAVYTVRAVSGGQAWLSDDQGNMKQVGPGSNLDGYGSVLRVFQPDGTHWVVDTTNGRIESQR